MRVTFLGTSASPSMPLPWCTCEACTTARQHGGKNLRRRSSLLINDDLLIDAGPDLSSAVFAHGVPLENISTVLQTHAHADHFDPEWVISRHPDYGTQIDHPLHLVASNKTLHLMDAQITNRFDYGSLFNTATRAALSLIVQPVQPYETITLGEYHITALPANHGQTGESLLYAVEYRNATLLYATDTAAFSEDLWHYLETRYTTFDIIILDHTYGIGYPSSDHLAAQDVIRYAARVRESGLLKPNGDIYATHLSHEGILEHDTLNDYATARGYRIAWDGLILNLADKT